ncbi:Cerato-platanin [Ascobolus immersus RN42]|uniref:Cerato-platanin n=1 Tax=Ascobolus immersus RN42 TaxID=1160509 RepID=A0A3N4I5L3_ASCIM|nr:Cerato-platanin [Ascobolus immersus RN42]
MKFTLLAALLPAAVFGARVSTSISWDPIYSNGGQSLATVACSDGNNGLLTKGYSTFGSLPQFPNIGGSPTIGGWNSANCGKCYNLYYNNAVVKVRAVDTAPGGWNVAKEVLDKLTGGRAEAVGRINGQYEEVAC